MANNGFILRIYARSTSLSVDFFLNHKINGRKKVKDFFKNRTLLFPDFQSKK